MTLTFLLPEPQAQGMMFTVEFWTLVTKKDRLCAGAGRADYEISDVTPTRPKPCGFSCLTFKQHLRWRPRFWRRAVGRWGMGENPGITWRLTEDDPHTTVTLIRSALEVTSMFEPLVPLEGGVHWNPAPGAHDALMFSPSSASIRKSYSKWLLIYLNSYLPYLWLFPIGYPCSLLQFLSPAFFLPLVVLIEHFIWSHFLSLANQFCFFFELCSGCPRICSIFLHESKFTFK